MKNIACVVLIATLLVFTNVSVAYEINIAG